MMFRILLFFGVAAALAGSVLPADAAAQARPIVESTMSADLLRYRGEMMEEYQKVMRAWSDAVGRGDARAAASFYAEDAVIVTAEGQVVQGRGAIERLLRDQIPQWGSIQVGLLDFEVSGALIYGLGTFAQGGGTVSGSYVTLLQRSGRALRIRSQTFAGTLAS
jgi:ketosteroid isomerase-like protein